MVLIADDSRGSSSLIYRAFGAHRTKLMTRSVAECRAAHTKRKQEMLGELQPPSLMVAPRTPPWRAPKAVGTHVGGEDVIGDDVTVDDVAI